MSDRFLERGIFNDFVYIVYKNLVRFVNIFSDFDFQVHFNNFKYITQCGDIALVIQKHCITKVDLKTLLITMVNMNKLNY